MEDKKYTILVVEDEIPLQQAINAKLSTSGFAYINAVSFDEAVKGLNTGTIDAVWLDHYLMGERDGLDLVREMKAENSKWRDIPVFVVSNTASQDKVQMYLHLGVSEYYVKAVNKLEQIIQDITERLQK